MGPPVLVRPLEPADGRVDLQGVGFPASFFMFSRPAACRTGGDARCGGQAGNHDKGQQPRQPSPAFLLDNLQLLLLLFA